MSGYGNSRYGNSGYGDSDGDSDGDQPTTGNVDDLGIREDILDNLVETWGEEIIDDLRELSQEERNNDQLMFVILNIGTEAYFDHKREKQEQDEQANNADFTGVEIDGSMDSSYSGDDDRSNDDITPMDEYDEDNAVNRGNVFFIPALSNDLTQPFLDKNSSLTVIPINITDYDCTIYLLAPTAVVVNYRDNASSDQWPTKELDDPIFDEHIEGLKMWAPENTRFVNRRLVTKPGWPGLYYAARTLIRHMFNDEHFQAPASDYLAYEVVDSAWNQLSKFLGQFTEWWQDTADACYRHECGQSVGDAKVSTMPRNIRPCDAGCENGSWSCGCDGGKVRCDGSNNMGRCNYGYTWMGSTWDCGLCGKSGWKTCQTCHGSGREQCSTCRGSGERDW